MPRLLLVDDNPSIHRIAESLLAPTDVVLVCVDSAAEALDRIGRGERFDVALIDTSMPGMDGWTLLSRLRGMDETALMPVAMMAGVLDPVDPAKLARAPIQGFLKKPIELRELGDRVKTLLATPVTVGPSPFSTVPAMPVKDLVKRAEEALPELRPQAAVLAPAPAGAGLDQAGPADDLLVLTAEDLWPEEPVPALPATTTHPVTQDVHLELEELDLESLQDLGDIPLQESGHATGFPSAVLEPHHTHPLEEEHLVTLAGLDELESLPTDFELLPSSPGPEPGAAATPVAHGTAPEPVAKPEPIHSHIPAPEPAAERPTFGHLPSAAVLLGMAGAAGAAGLAAHGLPHETHEPSSEGHGLLAEVHPPAPEPQAPAPQAATIHPAPEPALSAPAPAPATGVLPVEPAAGGQATAAAGHGAPTPEPGHEATEQARAVVQALLADPALMDVLVKALVARTSDQVLREIAWEVMPDLAGRLQR